MFELVQDHAAFDDFLDVVAGFDGDAPVQPAAVLVDAGVKGFAELVYVANRGCRCLERSGVPQVSPDSCTRH